METCEICTELAADDPRYGEHPATWEVTTQAGDTFKVCDTRLAETEAGFAEYDAPVTKRKI